MQFVFICPIAIYIAWVRRLLHLNALAVSDH